MASTLSIGDFSRATLFSVKTLRLYHKVGLLEPAQVDPDTGYRSYTIEQIATAQVIRRFRDLICRAVLSAPDVEARNQLLTSHLGRLEVSLARTQEAVTSLRNLLDHPPATTRIDHRHLAVTSAAAVIDTVDLADAAAWSHGALGELRATLTVQGISPTDLPAASTPATYIPTNVALRRSSCPANPRRGRWDG